MLTKEAIEQTIDALPETFTVDDVIERIIFLDKINAGLEQSGAGKLVDNASVKRSIEEWSA